MFVFHMKGGEVGGGGGFWVENLSGDGEGAWGSPRKHKERSWPPIEKAKE